MPFTFTPSSAYFSKDFFYSLCFSLFATVSIWEGNSFIVQRLRQRLRWESSPFNRIVAQVGLTLSYSIAAFLLLNALFTDFFHQDILKSAGIGLSILGVSLITLMVNAIYESIYFSRRWRFSVMRAEVLKRSALRGQYESLKNQINPHFLFNSLNALNCLIDENSEEAIHFVQSLASAYRYLLQNRDYKLVRLQEELNFTQTYTYLLQTRFGNGLNVHFDVKDEELQKTLPPLCMQILVENAVRHNVVSREHPLHIHIEASGSWLKVTNNLQLKPVEEEYPKLGLGNIRDRYKELSQKPVNINAMAASFTVELPLI